MGIVKNNLYFMGGNLSFSNGTTTPTDQMYRLSLDEEFSVDGQLDRGALQSSMVLPEVPSEFGGGAFLVDNTTLYVFAGLETADTTEPLYGFNVSTNEWISYTTGGPTVQRGNRLAREFHFRGWV